MSSLLHRPRITALTALTAVVAIAVAAGGLVPTNAVAAAPTANVVAAATVGTGPPTVQTVAGTTDLTGIACTGTACLAVGNSAHGAVVLSVTAGALGAVRTIPKQPKGLQLYGVACGSPGHCLAIGSTGERRSYVIAVDGGTPRAPVATPGADTTLGIACPTATRCVAVGMAQSPVVINVDVRVARGVSTAHPSPAQVPAGTPDVGRGKAMLTAIACPTATTCYAVLDGAANNVGAVVPVVDGIAGAARRDAGGASAIACASAAVCYAVGGSVRTITAGIPSSTASPAPVPMNTIACSGTTNCAAEGPGGIGFPVVDDAAGPHQSVPGVILTRAMSCPSATVCYAVGDGPASGVVTTLHPPTGTAPGSQHVDPGGDAVFSTTTSGTPAAQVQWQVAKGSGLPFANIASARATSYTVRNATPADSGNRYRAVVTNAAGAAITDAAVLSVGRAAAITSGATTTFPLATDRTFTITAAGDPAPTLAETGRLPNGVTFTACPVPASAGCAAGSAHLAGRPRAGTGGRYPIKITATNRVGAAAVQSFTLTITKARAAAVVTSSQQHLSAGGPVTLTAAVRAHAAAAKPSGAVRFYDGHRLLGTMRLTGDPAATLRVAAVATGRHQFRVAYSGDDTFAPATSATTSVVAASPASPPPTATAPGTSSGAGGLAVTGPRTSRLVGVAGLLLLVGGLVLLLAHGSSAATRRRGVAR